MKSLARVLAKRQQSLFIMQNTKTGVATIPSALILIAIVGWVYTNSGGEIPEEVLPLPRMEVATEVQSYFESPEKGQEEWEKLTEEEQKNLEGQGIFVREFNPEHKANVLWKRVYEECAYTQRGTYRKRRSSKETGDCSYILKLLREYLEYGAEIGIIEEELEAAVCFVESTCCIGAAAHFSRTCDKW